MKNMTNDEIYTFDEVLQILKTSKQQLRKLLKDGEIKGFKALSSTYCKVHILWQ